MCIDDEHSLVAIDVLGCSGLQKLALLLLYYFFHSKSFRIHSDFTTNNEKKWLISLSWCSETPYRNILKVLYHRFDQTLHAPMVISVKFLFVISTLYQSRGHENKGYDHPTRTPLVD